MQERTHPVSKKLDYDYIFLTSVYDKNLSLGAKATRVEGCCPAVWVCNKRDAVRN